MKDTNKTTHLEYSHFTECGAGGGGREGARGKSLWEIYKMRYDRSYVTCTEVRVVVGRRYGEGSEEVARR